MMPGLVQYARRKGLDFMRTSRTVSMEMLDQRQLLTATFSFSTDEWGSKVLTVSATANNDRLLVTKETTYIGGPEDGVTLVHVTAKHNNGPWQVVNYISTTKEDQLGIVRVKGASGNDQIKVTNFDNFNKGTPILWVEAGAGNDMVECNGASAIAEGGTGNDTLRAWTNLVPNVDDKLDFGLYGNSGNDRLIGSNQPDNLNGGKGNDRIIGNGGNDYIFFGEGNDYVDAGAGDDYMMKEYTDMSHSIIFGGLGEDTLAASSAGENPSITVTFSQLLISDDVEVLEISPKG